MAWSPDGTRLASGSADGTAKVWDAAGGRELLTLAGHTGFIRSVAWSPDGTRLATGGDDGAARIWEAAVPEQVRQWDRQERAVRDVPARERLPRSAGAGIPPGLARAAATDPWPRARAARGRWTGSSSPSEANLRPRPGDRVAVGREELVWRQHRSAEAVLDFNAVLGRATGPSVAYAVCYIESDRARDGLWLQIGSDDQSKAYLNGQEIYQCPVSRPLETPGHDRPGVAQAGDERAAPQGGE